MHVVGGQAPNTTGDDVQVEDTSYFADQQTDAGTSDADDGEGDEDSDEGEGASDDDSSSGDSAQGKQAEDAPFTATQQERVNSIVQKRLERQEQTMLRDMANFAGVPIEKGEVNSAARLWGLLKVNPSLSSQVEAMIEQYVAQNPTAVPKYDGAKADGDMKAAVLDMRSGDQVFNKYHKQVLEWAEEQGYEVRDAQTLKLVYGAWKNSNPNLVRKQPNGNQTTSKGKQTKGAPVQARSTGSGQVQNRNANPRKLNDKDFLASKGLSLFTE